MAKVSWVRQNRFWLGACGQHNHCAVPIISGDYAVTRQDARHTRPKGHTVLDLTKQVPLMTDDLRRWSERNDPDQSELFVFLRPIPGSAKFDRTKFAHN
jgi:hypothetical protein